MAEQHLPVRTIRGNIGKVEDLRYTSTGKAVSSFSVAETRKVDGQEVTFWYKCTLWEQDAPMIEQLHKGQRVMVLGTFEEKTYTKGDGTLGTELAISVWEVAASIRRNAEARPQAESAVSAGASSFDSDEEVPF